MDTDNKTIKNLINSFTSFCEDEFDKNSFSIYLMGSLSRGGFSILASDIDLGVVFIEKQANLEHRLLKIKETLQNNYKNISNNISIFYGFIDDINHNNGDFRYPLFDKLDLIEHGTLLYGKDIKTKIIKPTFEELIIDSAKFSLSYLANNDRLDEFKNVSKIVQKGNLYLSKTILFPVRFIYFANSKKISGNDDSVAYYLKYVNSKANTLVKIGYELRKVDALEKNILNELENSLSFLYIQFIDTYINILKTNNENKNLIEELKAWKNYIL